MGIDYSGVLIYGIKYEWTRSQIEACFGKIEYVSFGIWKIQIDFTDVFFCSIPGMFDGTRFKFIGLRCYESPDYTPININLKKPKFPEFFILQKVMTTLSIPKQNPEWYLMPRGK
jgi:hypothetical protein